MLRHRMLLVALIGGLFLPSHASAQTLAEKWRQGLSGARLTAYSGSAVSSNSSLTVIEFCSSGRYRYYREASWSVPGAAGGASDNRITGKWSIRTIRDFVTLAYTTDAGDSGEFRIYLQNNGRVNIGGVAYAVQEGAAGC